jgi:hypothetical protein
VQLVLHGEVEPLLLRAVAHRRVVHVEVTGHEVSCGHWSVLRPGWICIGNKKAPQALGGGAAGVVLLPGAPVDDDVDVLHGGQSRLAAL